MIYEQLISYLLTYFDNPSFDTVVQNCRCILVRIGICMSMKLGTLEMCL